MQTLRIWVATLVCCASINIVSAGASAQQTYPSKPIQMIVSYPAGGSTDTIARLFAAKLSQEMGQPVVVDNKPGAGTNIGSNIVANAKPDGYTVLFGGGTPTLNAVFGPVPAFDPIDDFQPVSVIARVPFVIATRTDSAFANVQEMISKSRAAPGKYTISSAQLSLYVELMKHRAQAPLLHVPYKGGAQATNDVIGGQIDTVFSLVPVVLGYLQSERLTALAVTSKERNSALPSVPALHELGVDLDLSVWFGLLAPANTPAHIVQALGDATRRISQDDAFSKKLADIGAQAAFSTPAELTEQMKQESQQWNQLAESIPQLRQAAKQR